MKVKIIFEMNDDFIKFIAKDEGITDLEESKKFIAKQYETAINNNYIKNLKVEIE